MGRRTFIPVVICALGLAACTPESVDPVLQAEELRNGEVADSLDLLQDLVDLVGPLLRAGDSRALLASDVSVRGHDVRLELRLTRLADSLLVEIAASDGAFGTLEFGFDPERGLLVDGTLTSGRVVATVVGARVRELADAARPMLFLGGNVDLEVRDIATGTAALVGRRALVLLEIDGVYSQGEIELDA